MYDHTQRGFLGWMLAAIGLIELGAASAVPPSTVAVILGAAGLVVLLLASSMAYLRVHDLGPALKVEFGPLPLFGVRVPYDRITRFRADRSTWLDGWGVHFVFGQGWIYNIHGRDCVRLELDRTTLRIGTDDLPGLLALLESKTRLKRQP